MTDIEINLKVSTELEGAFDDQETVDIEQKLQRVAELAQQRANRAAERAAAKNAEPEAEPETRRSIRERLVQQTQSSRPSVQRRNRQHPRRSASFHTGDTNVQIANDIQNFREAFESARSNIFGSTSPGVVEGAPTFPSSRRNLDISSANWDNSAPSSGSSTPRIIRRAESDAGRIQDLDDPFASVLSDLGISTGLGSNPNVTESGRRNGSRSSSATREGRGATTTNYQRFVMTNPAEIARSSSRNGRNETRRSRMPERRRRTIGVETADVREAMALTSAGSHERINQLTSSETRPIDRDNISFTRDSFQYSSYRPLYQRKIEINEASTRPILGDVEAIVYVDNKGHCHWLEKTHPLLKAIKDKSQPPITVNYKQEIEFRNDEEKDSITDIPGDPTERINKIRELIENSRNREGSCNNGYTSNQINGENGNSDLDEIDAMFMNKKKKKLETDPTYTIEEIEERFKHVSYYTKPRPRPDINSYKLMRKYKSIYDYEGSDRSQESSGDGNHVTRPGTLNLNGDLSNSTGNGLHITVTDTAERNDNMRMFVRESVITSSGSLSESANAGNEMRGDTNRTDSVNRPYLGSRFDSFDRSDRGYRSPSTTLHRSASVQDTPTSSGSLESPTSRMVRHGSLESFSQYSGQSPSRNNNTNEDIHEEVESLINRLQQRHAYAEIPIDTSHLDIEEMRMIQKALEENPSPPPTPSDFEAEEELDNTVSENFGNITVETEDSNNVTLEPGDNGGNIDGMTEFGPLSPVQEVESPSAEADREDTVHTVFDEFVSTVNEERTLNLPRGHIFSNR